MAPRRGQRCYDPVSETYVETDDEVLLEQERRREGGETVDWGLVSQRVGELGLRPAAPLLTEQEQQVVAAVEQDLEARERVRWMDREMPMSGGPEDDRA